MRESYFPSPVVSLFLSAWEPAEAPPRLDAGAESTFNVFAYTIGYTYIEAMGYKLFLFAGFSFLGWVSYLEENPVHIFSETFFLFL